MIACGTHAIGDHAREASVALGRGPPCEHEKTQDRQLHQRPFIYGDEKDRRRARCFGPRPGQQSSVLSSFYSPGVMRWAVVVPAFMIHTPPCLLSSGNPSDALVAPGTAIVM